MTARTRALLCTLSAARPALDLSTVTIYTSADKVPGKYDEVALIDSHGDDALTSDHQMVESMRKQAAKVAHVLIGTSADRKGKSVAIWVYPVTATTSAQPATAATH
jgi:reverse gyrase